MSISLPPKLLNAERKAAGLLDRYGISAPEHIRLKDIAFDLGADVIEDQLEKAVASLTRVGDCATIRVRIGDDQSRKRFSIAHELGHLVLKHFQSLRQLCSAQDMESWHRPDMESEANFFASELILPQALVVKRCDVRKVDFNPIREIADDYRASLTAAAIKFVRLCPEACALICSKEGKIAWSYKSDTWWPRIQNGQKLNPRTCANEFFIGNEVPGEPIELEADAWIEARGVDDVVEHAIAAPNFGFVLSVLWIRT